VRAVIYIDILSDPLHAFVKVGSLVKKYKTVPSLENAKDTFHGLTKSLSSTLIEKWTEEVNKAMRERGNALKIFDVMEKKGMTFHDEGLLN